MAKSRDEQEEVRKRLFTDSGSYRVIEFSQEELDAARDDLEDEEEIIWPEAKSTAKKKSQAQSGSIIKTTNATSVNRVTEFSQEELDNAGYDLPEYEEEYELFKEELAAAQEIDRRNLKKREAQSNPNIKPTNATLAQSTRTPSLFQSKSN